MTAPAGTPGTTTPDPFENFVNRILEGITSKLGTTVGPIATGIVEPLVDTGLSAFELWIEGRIANLETMLMGTPQNANPPVPLVPAVPPVPVVPAAPVPLVPAVPAVPQTSAELAAAYHAAIAAGR